MLTEEAFVGSRPLPVPLGVQHDRQIPYRSPSLRQERIVWILIGLLLVMTITKVPEWAPFTAVYQNDLFGIRRISYPVFWWTLLLAFSLCLALSSPRQSGLHFGRIREHWRRVLLVCGGPPLLVALVYPYFPERPWGNAGISMWLVSPLQQSLIFIGFLYGRFEPLFPDYVHPRLPVSWALTATVCLFSIWHVPNFLHLPFGYVVFQLFYTSVFYVVPALSRQWTGSILYIVLCHSAINFLAWRLS